MAHQKKLTGYELRRLENIKRNDEMLASLKIHSKIDDLSASTKRQIAQIKSYKNGPEKKSKIETPIFIRRSLRTKGMPPDATNMHDFDETLTKTPKSNPKYESSGPITIGDAYCGYASHQQKFTEKIMGVLKKPQLCCGHDSREEIEGGSCNSMTGVNENVNFGYPIRVQGCVDLESMGLEPENIARVVPGRILVLRFFPSTDMKLIAVGNKFGNVGFWDFDAENADGDGIYLYRPHPGPVSGIVIQPFSISKVYTSCYDGFIRLMDVEKEIFDLVYSSDHAIFSISQRTNDTKSLYFSEGHGVLNIWDERAGKSSASWILHEDRINTIDFNSENTDIMATSSTDGTACIWDLRNIDADKPKCLKMVNRKRAVHSAYFSPSGSYLATTSIDDNVGLLTGANFEDITMINHNNKTGRWISSFRAIWGWDDSHLFIGNMKRGVDVISTARRVCVATLQSPNLSAIPCRFDTHPYQIGMLAGATSGGQVYTWTTT
ncbi:WD repeat-containing protein 76-like [Camellia sinensis]|uniref:WD repeat-containing protein 76-like n=1 Tax=Camellia sinensis TaxID=4442 RepID=UPI0010368C60|nr:WD repeat-containing protein 76-like [Camellia sinensis]